MKRHLKAEHGQGRGRDGPTPPAAARSQRRPLTAALFLVLAVAAVVGAVSWWLRTRTEPSGPAGAEAETVVNAEVLAGPAYTSQATIADLKQVASEATSALCSAYPQSADARNVQAQLEFHLGNTPEAVRLWEQCLAEDPKAFDALYGLGFIACLEGENAKAVERFRAAMAVNPDDVRIPLMLADCLTRLGKPDEAAPLLQECLKRDPRSAAALLSLGQVSLDLKKYEQSRTAFEQLLAMDPNNRDACFGLGKALARLGETEKSKQVMERFRSLVANERPASSARVLSFDDLAKGREVAVLIFSEVAKVYVAHGNSEKAEEAWVKASAVDPRDVKSRLELAALYERTDRNHAVLRICEQLRDIEPKNAAYWANVGVLKARVGHYEEGLAAVEEAIKLDPANPEYRHARELIRSAQ